MNLIVIYTAMRTKLDCVCDCLGAGVECDPLLEGGFCRGACFGRVGLVKPVDRILAVIFDFPVIIERVLVLKVSYRCL